jgi:hypothetical protein
MQTQNVSQILLLALPVAIIELGLMIYCVVDLARRWKVKTLTPVVWLLLIIIINLIGPILYLLLGRSDEE